MIEKDQSNLDLRNNWRNSFELSFLIHLRDSLADLFFQLLIDDPSVVF